MYSRVRVQIPLSVFAPRYGTRSFIKCRFIPVNWTKTKQNVITRFMTLAQNQFSATSEIRTFLQTPDKFLWCLVILWWTGALLVIFMSPAVDPLLSIFGDRNQCTFRHSSRRLPLNGSTSSLSVAVHTSKTRKLYEVPKRFGFNEFSSDFAGQNEGTKKPAGLAPCGLLGLHRMTLVITDGEFWWSWRELNPRPNVFIYLFLLKSCSLRKSA